MTLKKFTILFAISAMLFSCSNSLKRIYKREVKAGLERTGKINRDIITEKDLEHLPPIVKKYVIYCGALGKEKVTNVRIRFTGKIRFGPTDKWMKFRSEQYNFFDQPTRLFYIKSRKMGISATGLHVYKNVTATMTIKVAGMFKVVDAKGYEMNQGETVTVFNDMCLLAPATLIDKNIQWEEIDALTVRAKFTNGNIAITATLFFNDKGELVNFISNDRFATEGKQFKNYPWFTPVIGYREIDGRMIMSAGSAIYQRPDSNFCYGQFVLEKVEYNVHQTH